MQALWLNDIYIYKDNFKFYNTPESKLTCNSSNFKYNFLHQRKHPTVLSRPSTVPSPEQVTFTSYIHDDKYKPGDPRQKEETDMPIAKDMLPLSLVKSHAFKQFVSTLDHRHQLPSRKHLTTKLLIGKWEAINDGVKQLLAKVNRVSITLDLWSNRQMHAYLGITCHFIVHSVGTSWLHTFFLVVIQQTTSLGNIMKLYIGMA